VALELNGHEGVPGPGSLDRLAHVIDHAAHLLPAQGPITVFIHHNTLHAFEDRPFDRAVRRGAAIFGCQPYLAEDRYRAELARGRIRFDGLSAVLRDDLKGWADAPVPGLGTRMEVRLAMLQHPVWTGPAAELDFVMAEADVLRRIRPDASASARGRFIAEARRWVMRDLRGRTGPGVPGWAPSLIARFGADRIESWADRTWEAIALEALWHVCLDGVHSMPGPRLSDSGTKSAIRNPQASLARHRDLLVRVTGADPDLGVHAVLIRLCAAFLDQGISHWPLPDRAAGLYRSFLRLYARPGGIAADWQAELRSEAARLLAANMSPLASVHESLGLLGVPESEWDEYLSVTLLALRGWAGMVRQVEVRGDRVAYPIPAGSLVEFLAVRLILDRLAAAHAARATLGYRGPLDRLRAELRVRLPFPEPPTVAQRAFPVFQIAQLLGRSADELYRLSPTEWAQLVREVEGFSEVERRRVFHLAYERRLRIQTLDALALHISNDEFGRLNQTWGQVSNLSSPTDRLETCPHEMPRFQAVTCLDEREESFRRHLEEVAPDAETFGAAGFFGVAMYYRGAADAHFVPLCPIVLTPGHWVEEQATGGHEHAHRRRTRARKVLGAATQQFRVGTRSAVGGAVLAGGLGALAFVPLMVRVLFPRLAARARAWFGRSVLAAPATRLKLERQTPDPGPANGQLGYTVEEMAAIAERLLRDVGLTTGFARLVFVLGHGSDSLNNPHKSAYDCGACGGSPGAPNGRALAQMLNDPRVRQRLTANGLSIPADTWFVGGFHNTCDDAVTLADADRVPEGLRSELDRAKEDLAAAGERNAHERARRFMSAPLDQSPADARRHVENRSEDLAQVRPELGHATNAICIVGRRARTRGLFFDRRAFLTSYDPTQDDAEGSTLMRILGAAVPVCGGINLEYYFSRVDSQGYGCGTKLPHNVTGLLGVMDGAESDLRTGLPWQMVEIHEPVRLLFVIETTPAVLLGILDRNPGIGALVRNGWVQMAVLDPASPAIQVYQDGTFQAYTPQAAALPTAPTSADWYRGWRDHLEFAHIRAGGHRG
jgi:uncharacterized protein